MTNDPKIITHPIQPGASDTNAYLPLLKGKRVALVTNHTALIEGAHLLSLLLSHKINITKIFGPEHGFRGAADDGAAVPDEKVEGADIPIISLWGEQYQPLASALNDVDIAVFDIQDVGCRFYTYINTLQWFMEAAAKSGIPLILLDRPNPNGHYIDGPVLEKTHISHLGLNPVPVVYGMTIGEYAQMLIGERWLEESDQQCSLTVILCRNYAHNLLYNLPVGPSPNLPNMTSVYLYPSMCFFEGTVCSVGRGTPFPFQAFGHPSFPNNLFSFTPKSMEGATDPKYKNQICHGFKVAANKEEAFKKAGNLINLEWMIKAYNLYEKKDYFFDSYLGNKNHFDLLAGNNTLRKAIGAGIPAKEIRMSWEPGIREFKKIRERYLLYPDYE
ncbi:MAG TPA: DUF1343 domain-containing protein [Ginsengibacter sp.]|nr:DUF1343 domain-containing protein [Ginsengibacter sp.]HRP43298.1 DUF1343 domain-containing protein [Ginsengibacter sp.]